MPLPLGAVTGAAGHHHLQRLRVPLGPQLDQRVEKRHATEEGVQFLAFGDFLELRVQLRKRCGVQRRLESVKKRNLCPTPAKPQIAPTSQ